KTIVTFANKDGGELIIGVMENIILEVEAIALN
ncbi:unnamed protein product, partial [marine sediment metagenome]